MSEPTNPDIMEAESPYEGMEFLVIMTDIELAEAVDLTLGLPATQALHLSVEEYMEIQRRASEWLAQYGQTLSLDAPHTIAYSLMPVIEWNGRKVRVLGLVRDARGVVIP